MYLAVNLIWAIEIYSQFKIKSWNKNVLNQKVFCTNIRLLKEGSNHANDCFYMVSIKNLG